MKGLGIFCIAVLSSTVVYSHDGVHIVPSSFYDTTGIMHLFAHPESMGAILILALVVLGRTKWGKSAIAWWRDTFKK